jgi:hypothetical protein
MKKIADPNVKMTDKLIVLFLSVLSKARFGILALLISERHLEVRVLPPQPGSAVSAV